MYLQRFPTDRAYFIAKELLTTERTYLKDLEVMTVVRKKENRLANTLLHCLFSPAPSSGEKTLIILVSCSIAERPPKHRVRQ